MENRRDLLKLASLSATFGLPLIGAGVSNLGNVVIDASNAKLTKEAFGDLRIFFEGPTAQLKSMTAGSLLLSAGREPHPPHQHAEEEFMIVTEGTGDILVGGRTYHAGPGSMMYAEAHQIHGVKNTGTTPLLFYFYKWQA